MSFFLRVLSVFTVNCVPDTSHAREEASSLPYRVLEEEGEVEEATLRDALYSADATGTRGGGGGGGGSSPPVAER